MKTFKTAALGFVLVLTTTRCQSPSLPSEGSRKPASTQELVAGTERVLNELNNDSIFNPHTCAKYINDWTDFIYGTTTDRFVPKTADEISYFKAHGQEVMKNMFMVRVLLRERFQQFEAKNESSDECLQKVREGINYARITEEYVLEWLVHNKVVSVRTPAILEADPVFTLTNPHFENFKLQTGDVMIIRGKSYVSAMIARIADEEGVFSHLALVTEDKNGKQYVTEALIQKGVITTPFEQWRKDGDARVALYRHKDTELARKAGRLMYDFAANKKIKYDFAMNDSDPSTFFCSEVAGYAFDKASGGKIVLPKFRSTITKFKDNAYPGSLGVTAKTLFAPYDMEVDPRFDFVAESKYYPLLRQVRMQDAVLNSVYGWMVEKKYNFHTAPSISVKSYIAKFIRQFGFVKDKLPTYMPIKSVKSTLQFDGVATTLEKNLYEKEAEFYTKNGYLPTFKDFLAINEEYRKQDCKVHKDWLDKYTGINAEDPSFAGSDPSKFHWYFWAKPTTCE